MLMEFGQSKISYSLILSKVNIELIHNTKWERYFSYSFERDEYVSYE